MSIANPLTASSAIQRAFIPKSDELSKENPIKPNLGVFESDIVEISQLGLEKQQKETQVEAARNIEDIANEVIRINSTIGRARSINNLTNNQATDLYNKISSLL